MKKGSCLVVGLFVVLGLVAGIGSVAMLGTQATKEFSEVSPTLRPSSDSTASPPPPPTKEDGPAPSPAKVDGPVSRSGRSGSLDGILEKLDWGNIAFNAPDSMRLKRPAVIQLLLSTRETAESLQAQLKAVGSRESARVQVSDRMEARLTGHGFDIVAITPEIQAVSRQQNTEWKWDIKPTDAGKQHLHLTLSAILQVDGEKTSRTIRTFDRDIEVNVTWPERFSAFVGSYWQWLWTAVLVPVGLWVMGKRGGEKGKAGDKAA